jgi:monoamine oxidase
VCGEASGSSEESTQCSLANTPATTAAIEELREETLTNKHETHNRDGRPLLVSARAFVGLTPPTASVDAAVDVIVMGAGMAGLAAAHHLIRSGAPGKTPSVLILEGADYVGGRIRALPWSDGLNLNIGAHWVAGDGPLHPLNLLLEAASLASAEKGCCKLTNFDPEDVPMLSADGSLLPYDWSSLTTAFECLEAMSDDARLGLSMEAALASVGWSPETEEDRLALWFFCDYEWGLSPLETPICRAVPAPYHTAFDSGNQRLVATDGGTPDLLSPLIEAIQQHDPGALRLGERVTAISREPDGLLAVSSAGQQEDRRFLARAVISTASLSVIASGAIAFAPPLPDDKARALAAHRVDCMAQYEIVLAEFGARFWAKHLPEGKTCLLYAGSPRMLIHDLGSYYDGRPILEFHLAGDDAVRVASQTLEETRAELAAVVRGAFGLGAPEPTRMYCTRWSSNPLTLGAFSVRPMGMTDEEHANLRRPCMGGRLLFAGDGLHEVHSGYMHAAYLSGVDAARAALRVLADGE